ncbi:WD repeat-containing protein mio-like [Tropilaelaps mercedesae]|uniref:WD repeat-containing protein mio-like n=1 Tax=Tropilaelaps mercedesae TaxID=418985 RepID=A0A1V9XY17_9ACAR|nr:WD repeat-containing protein mio-like [Tropilaelaps mercedesae]
MLSNILCIYCEVGILLTGLQATKGKLNTQLLDLLQNYVDNTADVQTAAAIAVVTRDPQVLRNERTRRWIECYRGLLNQWRLWTERALFDCAMAPLAGRNVAPQIRVHCNFCRKAISANNDQRGRPSFRPMPPAQRVNKLSQ